MSVFEAFPRATEHIGSNGSGQSSQLLQAPIL